MEIYLELGIDVLRRTLAGWDIVSILVKIHIFYRHRTRRYIPGRVTDI